MHQIVEYRRYTLHPARRDELVALFEREFVEAQEEEGMALLGQFRVLDRPDLFVWLRGFPDMATRGERLGAFYTSAVWKQNRDAANATMVDSDDVFLLRPSPPRGGFTHGSERRAPPGSREQANGLYLAVIWFVTDAPEFATRFAREIAPLLQQSGGSLLATYETAVVENDFPALPVRPETVFLCFAAVDDAEMRDRIDTLLVEASADETLWLRPTERSSLRR